MLNWTDIHRWLYVRQLCKSTAWNFVMSSKQLDDWPTLRAAMLDEFAQEVNSTHAHDALRARKKKSTENYKDYLIAVTGLAKSICLEESAIIEYGIRGIVLYRC